MEEAISLALSGSTLADGTRKPIKAELRLDVAAITREIASRFSGRSAHWTKRKDRVDDTVRRFFLEATPVFPWQFEEVRVNDGRKEISRMNFMSCLRLNREASAVRHSSTSTST